MSATPSISWREPRWSYRPRYLAEIIESGLFTFGFWFRVYIISGALAAAAILFCYLTQPGFRLPPQVFAAPLVVPLFIFLKIGLLYLIPPTINISAKRILISHGDSSFAIDRSKPLAASISAEHPDFPELALRYTTRRGHEHTRIYGIPPHIDLADLHNLLTQESP